MSWFDSVLQTGYKAKAGIITALNHAKSHVPAIKENVQSWVAERNAEHQRLSAERENAQQRIVALKDQNRFRGMTHEQRAAEITQTAQNMPGGTQILHAHPVGRAITAPFKFVSSAILSLGKKGVQIAPRVTPGSNTWLIILALAYHLFIILRGAPTLMTRIWANVIMILLITLVIFDSSERNGDNYRILILIALVFEIALPYIVQTFSVFQKVDFIQLYIANGFIVLTWLYYAVFVRGKDLETGLTKWLRIAIILFWLGVAYSFIGQSFVEFNEVELDNASMQAWSAAKLVFSRSYEGWATVGNTIKLGFSNVKTIFTLRMKQATGEYYFGVVEENEKEPLGVYLENLKSSQTEYEDNEPITIYATLMAKTLDDTVNVKVGCYAGEEENKIQGTVYPSESFEISNLQQEELDCTFDRLSKGTHKVTYTADFNFETVGYLKRYFADRNAIAAATRQNIDLLEEYQIIDTNPVAHYTNGPVAMGIGPEQALIGISEDYAVKPRLAFTLDSTKGWGGTIAKLNEVVLIIPEEMSLDTTQCTDKNWIEYSAEDCAESEIEHESRIYQECNEDESCVQEKCEAQLESYNAYSLDVDNPSYTNIKDYITLSCRMNVDNAIELLGATPIATQYFYVKARYDYQTSEDTSVTVEAAKDSTITIEGASLKSDSVPSFTLSDKERELQFIFYNYGDYLFDAQQKFNIPVCDIAGIIAYPSHSNPTYFVDGKKGLMAVPDSIIVQYQSTAGYSSPQPYDPETNIMIGTALMQYIYSIATDDETRFMAYYLEINDIEEYDQNANNYAAFVKGYKEKCEELGLNIPPAVSETGVESAYYAGSYSSPLTSLAAPVMLFTADAKPVAISAVESAAPVFGEADVLYWIPVFHLYYNSVDRDDTLREPLGWTSFENIPLLQMYYSSTEDTAYYRYFTDFVVNTDPLVEDEDKEIIQDVLYVEYTGSEIIVKLANNPTDKTKLSQICDVPWTKDTAMQTCIPGLIIRNMITDESLLGSGVAQVQLDWSVARQMEAAS